MAENPLHHVAELLLQIAIILIVAKIGGEVFERFLKLPSVLGELIAGILISPFAFGALDIPLVGVLFTLPDQAHGGSGLPVDITLYFVAQLGAVVLLFEAGLETNRSLFLKYVGRGFGVAIGGVVVPFLLGFFTTILFGFASFESIFTLIPALFVGTAFTATSVGITARVLSDMHRLDSPEGVTILSAAVVDDVLGIIILAIVTAISLEGQVTASSIGIIFAKAFGFWLGLTIIGSLLAPYISRVITGFRSTGSWLGVTFALAFAAAAIAESYFGLAMIIGSYSLGLALSATNLKERIASGTSKITLFVAPIFFVVTGMQVDFTALFSGDRPIWLIILFAVVLSLVGIVSKLLGAGLPSLALGFNRAGAARIGSGMLPRGEVALIIAGVGLGAGVITRLEFGFVIVMTVVTTVLAPILLRITFKGGSGLRRPASTSTSGAS